jgi:MFS family permease
MLLDQPPPPRTPGEPVAVPTTALAPLKHLAFRMLWATWLVANTCMWMNDVAAAWLMTTLAPSPLWVALVQSAATLPVLLLGLPSGALADMLDRRRFLIGTQLWVACVACLMCLTLWMGWMNAPLLLALTFANGIGLAMRWPVYAAVMPELVPRAELAPAVALNGVAMNASRIAGPLIAGTLIAAAGSGWVFGLNAVLSVGAAFVLVRWKRPHTPSPLGNEPLGKAMRVGLQFVRQSPQLKGTLLRVSIFFFHSTALLALLPLVARGLQGGDAGSYTLLLAAMGSGAIVAALQLQRIRQWLPREQLLLAGSALQSVCTLIVAYAPGLHVALPAMFVAGTAWITVANTLTVSAQMALPDWVRARGMATYQIAIMGSSALGAALWGQVASMSSIQTGLAVAALSGSLAMLLGQRWIPHRALEEDLSPSTVFKAPVAQEMPTHGPIQVHIEYRIDPAQATEFRALMQISRSSRMRQGAQAWNLLHDLNDPSRYIEQITDTSWTEHLRRFDRVTAGDVALRDRKLAFHIGETPPVVTRCVVEPG